MYTLVARNTIDTEIDAQCLLTNFVELIINCECPQRVSVESATIRDFTMLYYSKYLLLVFDQAL